MKKIAIIAGLCCMALQLSAAVTPTGKVNITLSSASDPEGIVLRIRQHATFSDDFDNTWDAETVQEGGIYVLYGGKHYSTWASNKFVDLPVGFGAGNDLSYTLTFSNFGGEALTFTDLKTGTYFPINASTAPYVFSIEASEKNKAINDRFVINQTLVQSLCFRNNILEIIDHAGESLVIKQGTNVIVNEASIGAIYTIDLSNYSGRLVVTLNGTDYQIDVNPTVTILP